MNTPIHWRRSSRPEGIKWPFTEDGRATNRLELITKLNGVEHKHAHDALSDVYATIAVAKLIKEKQPKLFGFLLKMRDKREVKKLVNLENKQPFVYVSGRYAQEYNKATVVFPLTSGRNGNVLVYDLRYNVDEVNQEKIFPIVKELCFNKCPAVAPVSVLDEGDGWAKVGLNPDDVRRNLEILLKHPDFAEKMRSEAEAKPEFPLAIEPEAALYDGFLNDADRIKVAAVRNAAENKLADFHPDFVDERLPELLLHYKGRNFPQSLSESEDKQWEEYRRARLNRLAPKFLKELEELYKKDGYVGEELKLYFEDVLAEDY